MPGTAIITGTTHGIGRITSRELARAGFEVVMLCRNLPAAEAVRREILAQAPAAAIRIIHCDLSCMASVRTCAQAVRQQTDRIALLINNAGMVSTRHRQSEDGLELTFATNHLGPFLLTNLLLDRMAPHGRIVNVASRIHHRGTLSLQPVADRRAGYSARAAYAQSKLANVMFTLALARRLTGQGITANCLHPGVVATNLLPRWLRTLKPLISPVLDVERGAQTSLKLAMASELAAISGQYFDEHGVTQTPSQLATDLELQEQLWAASARWSAL